MKSFLLLSCACMVALLLIAAGCTQQPAYQPTPVPTVPTVAPTMPPTPAATPIPTPIPTVARPAVPLTKIIKDTPLLFTISAPDGFTGNTVRARTSDYSIVYKTTIFNRAENGAAGIANDTSGIYVQLDDALTIFSYSSSYSNGQSVRDTIRSSGAVSNESSVTYKGIKYIRFDVASDPFSGKPGETIVYVGDKGSANEKGYLPVLIYTVSPTGKFGMDTFENMIQSFAYIPGRNIDSAPGEETSRPPFYQ